MLMEPGAYYLSMLLPWGNVNEHGQNVATVQFADNPRSANWWIVLEHLYGFDPHYIARFWQDADGDTCGEAFADYFDGVGLEQLKPYWLHAETVCVVANEGRRRYVCDTGADLPLTAEDEE